MNQSNETGKEPRNTGSAEEMQRANASGDNQNEQGQASFTTGSTIGGGSNFGQGSSHLGGESYRQGSETNSGSSYNNEAGRLGASATGTANEGSSDAGTGAAASGYDKTATEQVTPRNDDGGPLPQDHRGKAEKETMPEEGERRDTGLEDASGLGDTGTHGDGRQSGSWSRATTQDD